MDKKEKDVERLLSKFKNDLDLLGFKIDFHAEFIGLLLDKNSGEVVAHFYEYGEIDWDIDC